MGNANSNNHLATPHVAKYMRLTKQQVMDIHEACLQLARGTRCFSRQHFHAALQHAQVTSHKDRDILTLLCTMWDLKGDGKVPCLEYSLSLVPLCCPGESMEQVLQFCFALIDNNEAVTSQETIIILKSTLFWLWMDYYLYVVDVSSLKWCSLSFRHLCDSGVFWRRDIYRSTIVQDRRSSIRCHDDCHGNDGGSGTLDGRQENWRPSIGCRSSM